MNKRIEELLDQAGLPVGQRNQVLEKFAELLINECMYVGRMSQINNGLVDSDIYTHFGVE